MVKMEVENMEVQISSTTQSDIQDLAEIYKNAYNNLKIGENWSKETAKELLSFFLEKQPDLFFTARVNGQIVGGIIAFIKPWWDGKHLTDGEIFVDEKYQKQGIGKKLIKKLFESAQDKYQAISWDTFTHRVYEHPLKWYKSIGFEEIKHWVMITGEIKKVLKALVNK